MSGRYSSYCLIIHTTLMTIFCYISHKGQTMELSIALVILILKVGIKHLDGNYNNQSFIDDIFDAFGKESGKKLMNIVSRSQTQMNYQLQKSRLKENGIPDIRTDKVIEDVKDLLKCTKITKDMLNNYDCNTEKIVTHILNEYSGVVGIKDDDVAINDVRTVLYQIVQEHVHLIQDDSEFINGVIFDIRSILKEHSIKLNGIDSTVKMTYESVEEINQQLKIITTVLTDHNQIAKVSYESNLKTMRKETNDWQPPEKQEQVNVDSEISATLIDLVHKNQEGK